RKMFSARRKTSAPHPRVGHFMRDGTKYAGISPDTHEPMYVTEVDAPRAMKWKEAMDYAASIDMRLPTKAELKVLFNNRAAIGECNVTGSYPEGWYWSASEGYEWLAWCQRFSDGFQDDRIKDGRSSVRCVRS